MCAHYSPICISKYDLDMEKNKLISLQQMISCLVDLLSELLIVKLEDIMFGSPRYILSVLIAPLHWVQLTKPGRFINTLLYGQ